MTSVDLRAVSFADATIARLPRPIRALAEQNHELIKFAIVGATTFVIDSVISVSYTHLTLPTKRIV